MKEDAYKIVSEFIGIRSNYNDIICARIRDGMDFDKYTEMCNAYNLMCLAIDAMIKAG